MKYSRGALGGVAGVGCRQVAVPKHTRPRLDAQCKARDCFHARQLANSGCRRSRDCLASHAFGITQILGLYVPRPCAEVRVRLRFLAVRGGPHCYLDPHRLAKPRSVPHVLAKPRTTCTRHHVPRTTHHAGNRVSVWRAGGRAMPEASPPPSPNQQWYAPRKIERL